MGFYPILPITSLFSSGHCALLLSLRPSPPLRSRSRPPSPSPAVSDVSPLVGHDPLIARRIPARTMKREFEFKLSSNSLKRVCRSSPPHRSLDPGPRPTVCQRVKYGRGYYLPDSEAHAGPWPVPRQISRFSRAL